jgi:hypothetical protein
LVVSEENESLLVHPFRMMIRMFNELKEEHKEELKENIERQHKEYKENTDFKKLRRHKSK